MKAKSYVASFGCDYSSDTEWISAKAATREEASKLFLERTAAKIQFDAVLSDDVTAPAVFADMIPDEMPEGYGLLVMRLDTDNADPVSWGWAAIRVGEFKLFDHYQFERYGKLVSRGAYVTGREPVLHQAVDTNCETAVKLPDESLVFRNGSWVPCDIINGWWEEAGDPDTQPEFEPHLSGLRD